MPPTDGPMFEYACHEGNDGMTALLEIARGEEAAAGGESGVAIEVRAVERRGLPETWLGAERRPRRDPCGRVRRRTAGEEGAS